MGVLWGVALVWCWGVVCGGGILGVGGMRGCCGVCHWSGVGGGINGAWYVGNIGTW